MGHVARDEQSRGTARVLTGALAAAAITVLLGAAPAMAREFRVSNNGSCPNPDFTSIQAAVTAAGPHDTVKVCPGTYTEQVRIETHAKDGLKLESLRPLEARIQFPPVTVADNQLVRVRGAQDVTIRGFTITGPFVTSSGCSDAVPGAHEGIRVDGGGDATIRDNHITQIQNQVTALFGCQDGIAVRVGRSAESTTGSAVIDHNVIDTYQKNGPTIDGAGSTATVKDNTIDGGGASMQTARNGVQVGRGASAVIHNNQITGNSYIGAGDSSCPAAQDVIDCNDATGILIFEVTGNVEASNNSLATNDLGLDLGTASGVLVRNNFAHDNRFDGLRAESDTQQNLFAENQSQNNGVHDCHDDSHGAGTAGTGNTWKNDFGVTQTPLGICRPNGQ
jgi:hypothetical protein